MAGYYGYGGVQTVAANLADGLSNIKNDKYQVTYICRKIINPKSKNHKFDIIELNPRNTLMLWKQLENYRKFDIIHTHDMYTMPGLLRRKNFLKEKLVYTHHGIPPLRYTKIKNIPSYFFAKWCLKKGLSKMNMNIAISNYIENVLKLQYKTQKVTFIPNGVEIENINKFINKNDTYKFEKETFPKLLFVGVYEKQKALKFLIKSIIKIQKKYPNIKLNMIGDGTYKKSLIKLVNKYDLNHCVSIHGYLQNSKKYEFYYSSDIIIIPSYVESFGIPIVEAMAFGKPVITRNSFAMPEHINKSGAGELFNNDSAEEIISAVDNVLDNYGKYSKAAKKYSRQFDQKKFIKKHIELYKKLLDS